MALVGAHCIRASHIQNLPLQRTQAIDPTVDRDNARHPGGTCLKSGGDGIQQRDNVMHTGQCMLPEPSKVFQVVSD